MEDQLKNGHLDFSDMIALCCRNPCLAILQNKKDGVQEGHCGVQIVWEIHRLWLL